LAKGGEAFHDIPMGNTLTYRLERDIILYAHSDQLSITAFMGFELEGAGLKATDLKHLPKPLKTALRTGHKLSMGHEEFLKWINSLKPQLRMENWRVLNLKLSLLI